MAEVRYNHRTVSDAAVQDILARIARRLNSDVTVTSGDRNYVPRGGARRSDHLAHRAADFHVVGMTDAYAFNEIRKNAAGIFPAPMAFQLIRHGSYTQTQGAHLHLGHPGVGSRRAGFWSEGLTPADEGRYAQVG